MSEEKPAPVYAAPTYRRPSNYPKYEGIVFSITDGTIKVPPTQTPLDDETIQEWFETYPKDVESPIIKMVTCKQATPSLDVPFSRNVIEEAIWHSEVYTSWSSVHTGGCAALPEEPPRLTLQTPDDGYPFVSLACAKKGHLVKAVYTYSHPDFDPINMMPGETLFSGWRSSGLQIISLPQAILRTHSAWLSRTIKETLDRIQAVETALASQVEDLAPLQRTLHNCTDIMLNLERRSEFENVIIAAVETIVDKLQYTRNGPWSALAPAKTAIALRKSELQIIPRRIESARQAINDAILQRAQLQGLELARATQRIAEATMNDSAAMKTIAILTMVFLPGTAVASFFSMTMWNWQGDGSDLVSGWIWIYFAVATPLTIMVVFIWWFWNRTRTREMALMLPRIVTVTPPYTPTKHD